MKTQLQMKLHKTHRHKTTLIQTHTHTHTHKYMVQIYIGTPTLLKIWFLKQPQIYFIIGFGLNILLILIRQGEGEANGPQQI